MVTRAIAADAYAGTPEGARLVTLADAAERSPWSSREACENESVHRADRDRPGGRPPALMAELAEAESRVLLARRFHNDAVRDTLALRDRRSVQLLRLGGRAPLPTYFEIAETAQR